MNAHNVGKRFPPLFLRNCGTCGTPLGMGRTHEGKQVWLDLKAKVYCPVFEKTDSHGVIVVRTELAFLDHNELCPGN